jgi:hypothetical protein
MVTRRTFIAAALAVPVMPLARAMAQAVKEQAKHLISYSCRPPTV